MQTKLRLAALRIFLPEAASDSRIMQHMVSGTLHVIGLEDRFMCGRFISVGYQFPPGDLVREWPLCQQCRNASGEVIEDIFGHV